MTEALKNTLLPTRLNAEPSIYKGCSLSELMLLIVLGGAVLVPLSVLVCALAGYLMMGFGLGLLLVITWVVIGASLMQRLKRDRPIGYYQLRLRLLLEDTGLVRRRFIRQGRCWSTGRSFK